jgi:hypothetical protein
LGKVAIAKKNHSVAKLKNNRYAVGHLTVGQVVAAGAQFETLGDTFEHWLATLPAHTKTARR